MDQNQNTTPTPETTNISTAPVEVPQAIESNPSNPNHRTLPIFIVFTALVLFVGSAAFLFYNYQYSTTASSIKKSNNIAPFYNRVTQPTLTPTPASIEEAEIQKIEIEEGTDDFATIEQTSIGL